MSVVVDTAEFMSVYEVESNNSGMVLAGNLENAVEVTLNEAEEAM